MHLVQILLPLLDNEGRQQPDDLFRRVRTTLTDRFGGLTTYSRAPARGLWQDGSGATSADEIVVYEVMVDTVDREWWAAYREELERAFRQKSVVLRATLIDVF
jgi:hypothetical protein